MYKICVEIIAADKKNHTKLDEAPKIYHEMVKLNLKIFEILF